MAIEICGRDVPDAYDDMLWVLRTWAVKEQSRNGPVRAVPKPVELTIFDPRRRVLFDPVRDANPFFHVMEFVWMMSGSKDLAWIKQFNSGFSKYSDDDKTLPASYGYRWRRHFATDQISVLIDHLRSDLSSRRGVLAMWDPRADQHSEGRSGNDRPCNTHAYFRVVEGHLDMTVCNRSNDAIWGMMGANVVHMTFLQELIAFAIGVKLGVYRVYTNNLHIYEEMPRFDEIWKTPGPSPRPVDPRPLLQEGENWEQFISDCEWMVKEGGADFFYTKWFRGVAVPMMKAYLEKEKRDHYIERIEADDWKLACYEWAERRKK